MSAVRRVEQHLEEDIVVNGNVTERACNLPPDVRCTIAVASSADGTVCYLQAPPSFLFLLSC